MLLMQPYCTDTGSGCDDGDRCNTVGDEVSFQPCNRTLRSFERKTDDALERTGGDGDDEVP